LPRRRHRTSRMRRTFYRHMRRAQRDQQERPPLLHLRRPKKKPDQTRGTSTRSWGSSWRSVEGGLCSGGLFGAG
jgi:hypothetical protein